MTIFSENTAHKTYKNNGGSMWLISENNLKTNLFKFKLSFVLAYRSFKIIGGIICDVRMYCSRFLFYICV